MNAYAIGYGIFIDNGCKQIIHINDSGFFISDHGKSNLNNDEYLKDLRKFLYKWYPDMAKLLPKEQDVPAGKCSCGLDLLKKGIANETKINNSQTQKATTKKNFLAKVTHLLYDDGFKLELKPECDEVKCKLANLCTKMFRVLYVNDGNIRECAEETYKALGLLCDFWSRIGCPQLTPSGLTNYRRL